MTLISILDCVRQKSIFFLLVNRSAIDLVDLNSNFFMFLSKSKGSFDVDLDRITP
ncbi:hypothetical protein CKA32_000076 [Geitlerinema sp. FC II]|nr:hypothetical protein CKA32_000076 [Geitlerinema sp. FC II]